MKTLKIGRQLMALLQPLTGQRATGTITLAASSTTPVALPLTTHLLPVVQSASGAPAMLKPELIFRTDAAVTVPQGGISIPITSVLGGKRHNLPAGTTFRVHQPVVGVNTVSSPLAADLSGGLDISGSASLQRIYWYEQLGPGTVARDLFLAKAGSAFPCGILVWESTGEGQALGSKIYLRPDQWTLHIVVSRTDAGELRCADATDIMDAVEDIITSRAYVDNEPFTSKFATLLSRSRLAVTDSSYVYSLKFETWAGTLQREVRSAANFPLWSRTQWSLFLEPPEPGHNPPNVTVVNDATYNQQQPPPPFP